MGFRFRKTKGLGHGLRLIVGKRSVGLSGGTRGAGLTVSTRGVTATASIPGTELSWTRTLSWERGGAPTPQSGGAAPREGAPASRQGAPAARQGAPEPAPGGFWPAPAELALWGGLSWAWAAGAVSVWFWPGGTLLAAAIGAATLWWWKHPARQAYAAYSAAATAWRLERWGRCRDSLQRVIDLGFPSPAVYLGLGRCELRLRNPQSARDAFGTALAASGSLPESVLPEAASAAMEAGDPRWVLAATDHAAPSPRAATVRAAALLQLNQPVTALEVCAAIVGGKRKATPDLFPVFYLQGEAYQHLGQTERARRAWAKIYAADPAYADVARRLGVDAPQ